MSESERRRKYRYNRVLIETARVLEPQFHDAVVFLSGAQIEMLRNVTQYLNRLETYVTEYAEGYYLAPTAEQYDSILETVADLEETLMGNPNVIWGYADRWNEFVEYTMTVDGSRNVYSSSVPNGYVYTLQAVVVRNLDTAVSSRIYIEQGIDSYPFAKSELIAQNVYRIVHGLNYTLKYGDRVYVRFASCLDEDRLELRVWGHKMIVPEE